MPDKEDPKETDVKKMPPKDPDWAKSIDWDAVNKDRLSDHVWKERRHDKKRN